MARPSPRNKSYIGPARRSPRLSAIRTLLREYDVDACSGKHGSVPINVKIEALDHDSESLSQDPAAVTLHDKQFGDFIKKETSLQDDEQDFPDICLKELRDRCKVKKRNILGRPRDCDAGTVTPKDEANDLDEPIIVLKLNRSRTSPSKGDGRKRSHVSSPSSRAGEFVAQKKCKTTPASVPTIIVKLKDEPVEDLHEEGRAEAQKHPETVPYQSQETFLGLEVACEAENLLMQNMSTDSLRVVCDRKNLENLDSSMDFSDFSESMSGEVASSCEMHELKLDNDCRGENQESSLPSEDIIADMTSPSECNNAETGGNKQSDGWSVSPDNNRLTCPLNKINDNYMLVDSGNEGNSGTSELFVEQRKDETPFSFVIPDSKFHPALASLEDVFCGNDRRQLGCSSCSDENFVHAEHEVGVQVIGHMESKDSDDVVNILSSSWTCTELESIVTDAAKRCAQLQANQAPLSCSGNDAVHSSVDLMPQFPEQSSDAADSLPLLGDTAAAADSIFSTLNPENVKCSLDTPTIFNEHSVEDKCGTILAVADTDDGMASPNSELCTSVEISQENLDVWCDFATKQTSDLSSMLGNSPRRLHSTRKVMSPTSHIGLCEAMSEIDLADPCDILRNGEARVLSKKASNKAVSGNGSCLSPVTRGILKTGHSHCKEAPRHTSTSYYVEPEKAIEFCQQQMRDIDSISTRLLKSLQSMKNIVDETVSTNAHSILTSFTAAEIKEASDNAAVLEKTTKKWLNMMAKDCSRFCKIMKSAERKDHTRSCRSRRRIAFADEVGGMLCHVKLIGDSLSDSHHWDGQEDLSL